MVNCIIRFKLFYLCRHHKVSYGIPCLVGFYAVLIDTTAKFGSHEAKGAMFVLSSFVSSLFESRYRNLVPRVSLLCLHCLNDNGGREERPWERGCRYQWKLLECPLLPSLSALFCG